MRGMRIDGSGCGAWNRDRETQAFGSRAWREHYGADAGARRCRADMASRDRARHEASETEAAALAQWEAEVERLAMEHAHELAQPAPRWNSRAADAMIVRVVPAAPLPEAHVTALISHGYRWSHRRGGMWWAPRTEDRCRLAASICEPPVIHITE